MLKRFVVTAVMVLSIVLIQSCKVSSPFITGAKINMQINDYQAAKDDLAKEINRDSTSVEAYYLMGYIYNDEENYEKMHESFEKVRSLDPEYEKANIKNMSLKAFGKLRSSGINDRYNKAVQIIASDPKKAENVLRFALKELELADMIINDDFVTKYIIGNINSQLGNKDKAIEIFKNAEQYADPEKDKVNLIGLNINLANLYDEKGDKETSLTFLKKILEIDANNKEALLKIARYHEDKENFEEALKMYEALLAQEPENVDVLFNQGIAFKKMKKLPEAIANFEKIVQLKPDDNEAKIFLGRFYFEAEKWQEAADIFDNNFDNFNGAEKEDAADYLTRILPKLGRAKEAQKYLEYLK